MKKPILLLVLIIAAVLPALSQRVFKDIAQGTDNAQIFSQGSFITGDTLFFSADTVNNFGYSYKYFRTTGTPASTKGLMIEEQLRYTPFYNNTLYYKFKGTIYASNNETLFKIKNDSIKFITILSNHIRYAFFELHNQLYIFTYNIQAQGFQIWRINSDDTITLFKTVPYANNPSSYSPGTQFIINNKFFFPFTSSDGLMFYSDGTPGGTGIFQNHKFSTGDNKPHGSYVYYGMSEVGPFSYRIKLWRSKGDSLTAEKIVHAIDDDTNYGIYNLFTFKNDLYFLSYSNYQFKISRLDTNSLAITHISSAFNGIGSILVKNDKIIYSNSVNGIENFYENDGDFNSERFLFSMPVSESDASTTFIQAGSTNIYLAKQKFANGGFEGDVRYWVYDGTSVKKITDLAPNIVTGAFINAIGVAGNVFYFNASDSQHGYELWRTDGTTAGTYLLKDINKKTASSFAKPMFGVGNYLYFMADDISHGNELWRTDGVNANLYADLNGNVGNSNVASSSYNYHVKYGNSSIADINTQFYHFTPDGNMKHLSFLPIYYFSIPHEYKNLLYFMGNDGNLWSTDCTIPGTKKQVHLDSTGNGTGFWGVNDLIKVDTLLFFNSNNGSVLWKTNGKKNGTVKLYTFSSPTISTISSSYITTLASEKILYFFRLVDYWTSTSELWASNGTTSGTIKLLSGNNFSVLGTLNNKLYFMYNYRLWQSDGTVAGTSQLDPRFFTSGMRLRDKIYLLRNDGYNLEYYELNKNSTLTFLNTLPSFDGTNEFVKIDDRYLLNVVSNGDLQHFYLTDGNQENIKKAFTLKKSVPYTGFYNFTYHNKKIYFSALDSLKGQELWIWDFGCPDGYTIRDNITKDSTIVYGKNIYGQNIISNNKTVTYDAKNGITLQPGFEAKLGTVFKTKLIGCANNNVANDIEDTIPVKNEPIVKVNTPTTYPQLFDFLYYLPNKSLKDTYEQAKRSNLAPITWDIVTEKDIYRLDLKIGSSVFIGWLPKKN